MRHLERLEEVSFGQKFHAAHAIAFGRLIVSLWRGEVRALDFSALPSETISRVFRGVSLHYNHEMIIYGANMLSKFLRAKLISRSGATVESLELE